MCKYTWADGGIQSNDSWGITNLKIIHRISWVECNRKSKRLRTCNIGEDIKGSDCGFDVHPETQWYWLGCSKISESSDI